MSEKMMGSQGTPEQIKKVLEENLPDAEKEQSEKREKFLKFREAVKEYKQEEISMMSEKLLERFHSKIKNVTHGGGFGFDPDPSGYNDEGVVYRNMVYHFMGHGVEENDDLNYSLNGLIIKKAMEMDSEFDKFVNNYINKAKDSDKKNWDGKDDLYNECVEREAKRGNKDYYPPKYILNPNDGRYTQGKYMDKYISGNI